MQQTASCFGSYIGRVQLWTALRCAANIILDDAARHAGAFLADRRWLNVVASEKGLRDVLHITIMLIISCHPTTAERLSNSTAVHHGMTVILGPPLGSQAADTAITTGS